MSNKDKFKNITPSEMYTDCPDCGAKAGENCVPEHQGTHGSRIEQFICTAPLWQRQEAHEWSKAQLEKHDIHLDEGDSIYFTEEEVREMANEAGMLHGADAYNEAMGWDTSAPEPCGHHCPSDCPRCGEV